MRIFRSKVTWVAAWLAIGVVMSSARIDAANSAAATSATSGSDRDIWVGHAAKLAEPVLSTLAERKLKERMPVENVNARWQRERVSHLEAFARLLCGLAPWLELGADDTAEGKMRARYAQLARAGLDAATDPSSPDRMNFEEGGQPLVDAAFLAQALLRAPNELWEKVEPRVRANVLTSLKATRAIKPYRSNWLLFASMVEVALHRFGEKRDDARLFEGVDQFQKWYLGDGAYGDGDEFHWDYYNAYVIHPMLVEILDVVGDETPERRELRAKTLKRAQRFAVIQERFIAPDGSFPVIGRSIAYRAGAFQGLAQIAWRRALPNGLAPAQVRVALTATIRRTLEAPNTYDAGGWLRIGLAGHQRGLAESYISTGSLYLCSFAFLPLGLPASDPFWSAPPQPTTWEKAWSGVDLPADSAMKETR